MQANADIAGNPQPKRDSAAQSAALNAQPSDYFLSDFQSVLAGVEQRYGALLTPEDHAHIANVKALSRPARLLYARLVNRKGPYFRVQNLAYPEIALDTAIAELGRYRLLEICVAPPPAARQNRLMACFTLPELRTTLQNISAPKCARAALLDWIGAWDQRGDWMARLLACHPVVALPESDPFAFFRFLFFGALRDNLSGFVTRALGHIVTETVDPAALRPCFTSRRQAEDAYRMACLYRTFQDIRDRRTAAELLEWWRSLGIERQRLADGHAWFDRMVDRLGRQLERENAADQAQQLYATSPVAPARERQARLLIKAGRVAEARRLVQAMASTPGHAQESYAARHLLARLEKKPRRSEARQLQNASRVIQLHYLPRSAAADPATTVEAAVLDHYRAQGWQGVHAENWLWNASFGLLLWDIIYDPAIGAFHSPLQFAPSDLYTPDFYTRRAQAIETRLQSLANPAEALAIMRRHIATKQGIANPFVVWRDGLAEILAVLLNHVPAAGHAAVLRHMASNLRHHAHGFLDLFIWNATDYRFIEIKSQNDQLAAHQFEWLRFFAQAGINVSLEKVVAPGAGNDGPPFAALRATSVSQSERNML